VLAVLAGCASPSAPSKPAPPAASPGPLPVSYDWHPLLIAPLGTWFRDMPVPLSEVLQFHEAGETSRGEECFKPKDMTPPAFLGRTPDDYLLCFAGDRLSRVEAAVHVAAAEAPNLFAAACGDWRRGTAPGSATAADACEGRDADVQFSAHLVDAAAAQADAGDAPPPAGSTIAISLARIAP
jgi:hypothetical protein